MLAGPVVVSGEGLDDWVLPAHADQALQGTSRFPHAQRLDNLETSQALACNCCKDEQPGDGEQVVHVERLKVFALIEQDTGFTQRGGDVSGIATQDHIKLQQRLVGFSGMQHQETFTDEVGLQQG